jgi:hypothetical protein
MPDSFKARRILRAPNKAHFGGDSNYTEFDNAGRQTMGGTGRIYRDIWIPADDFVTSGTAVGNEAIFQAGSMISTSILIDLSGSIFADTQAGATPVQVMTPQVDITGSVQHIVTTFPVPPDADTTGSIGCHLLWTAHDTHATAGSVFVFKAGLGYLSSSAAARTAASTSTCATYNYTASGVIHETDLGDLPSFGADDVAGVLVLAQDQTDAADTGGSGQAIIGAKLRYVANSLGTQSTE